MTPRYPPTVTIAGKTIPTSWDGTGLVAVDKLAFIWGRAELTDIPRPTDMTAYLIDLDGSWASNASLYGASVVVTTALTTVFRGTIDGIQITPSTIRNPDTGRTQQVYSVTLSAVDPMAELHKTFPPGPGGSSFENEQYGPTHHPARTRSTLLTFLRSASAAMVSTINILTDVSSLNYVWGRREMSENLSIAEFIRQMYSTHSLSWINYDPASNAVDHGLITPVTPRGLTYDGTILSLSGPGIHAVSGSQVDAAGAGQIVLGLQENIAAVVHTYAAYKQGPTITWNSVNYATTLMSPRTHISTTPYLDGVKGSNVHEITSGILQLNGYTSPTQITANTADRFRLINGQLRAPGMIFDLERTDYGPALETILLSTRTTMESVYIMGTLYARLVDFLPHFQIIGGSLIYQDGWTFEPSMAPTRNPKTGTLTVAQLVTTDTPTMSQFDPNLCLADLGNLDTGVTT